MAKYLYNLMVTKKLLIILALVVALTAGVYFWLYLGDDQPTRESDLPSGVLREDSLEIKTDNPQPAGLNIQD